METSNKSLSLTVSQWRIEEYIAYMYLSIADADMDITDLELRVIRKRVSMLLRKYFPNINVDLDFLLKHLRSAVETLSDFERMKIIDSLNKKHQLSKEVQTEIISDLHELINVDNEVAFTEYTLINYIRACFVEHRK